MSDARLTDRERAVIRLSGALASRSEARLRSAAEAAARHGDPVHVEEALLQSYLFLGYPVALNGFLIWREVSERAPPPPTADRHALWRSSGERICRIVYGGQYARLRDGVRALHPDMERWMIEEGYGKVLSRPGMPLELRELCIAAMLAVYDAPRQLYSHLRGALNAGAAPARVEDALELALEQSESEPSRSSARSVWVTVRDRGAVSRQSMPEPPS